MLALDPHVQDPLVRVTANEDRTIYTVSWPAQPGASGYRVYAGFDPISIRSLISGVDPLPHTQLSFQFNAPPYPPNQIIYFWVRKMVGPAGTFINDSYGSYTLLTSQYGQFVPTPLTSDSQAIMCWEDKQYIFEEMRRRAKAILEDTGEPVDVFIRQWTGLPDPTTQNALALDPNYQGMTRDDNTFGTGFYPGFYPAIRINMRFGALPAAMLDFQMPGLRPLQANEAWTNWEPLLHENDLIVRVSNGNRYAVTANAFSNYRGVPITQRMQLQNLQQTSPLFKVTDALVRERWGMVNAVDFARTGFGVAADATTGGPDYLIFG
jgi:hypothetical protein